MYKAVICDLDGTLLNSEHTISDYTRNVIKKVHDKGIKIFIATGRHYKDTVAFKKMLGLDSYIITSNGAKIHDENNNEVYSQNIPADIVTEVIKTDIDNRILQCAYQDDLWYCNEHPKAIEEYYKESGFEYILKNLKDIEGTITKFFFIHNGPGDVLGRLEQQMRERFEGRLMFTYSMPNCFEMQKLGVSKGAAIENILEKVGISTGEAIAFGDGLNDYEMLSVVKKGVLMGNCSQHLRTLLPANEVADTCDNNGVAKYLQSVFNI